MTDRLDAALLDLANEIEFPATPDLRPAVIEAVRSRPSRRWIPSAWPRALVLAILATLLVVAAATALVIAIPSLRLTFAPSLPSPAVPDEPLATRLSLGEEIVPGDVAAGIPALLGAPDEAYVLGDHRVLSLVYAASDDLPEMGNRGIGLLVQVIDGALDRELVMKLAVEGEHTVTTLEVNGVTAYWIEGPPHLVWFNDPSGRTSSTRSRLAGDTLVWQAGDVLYRIESGLGLVETLRIAESIEP